MTFLNRRPELQSLARAIPPRGNALFVLYGRRRVGKTELLKHFMSDRPHVFFTGDLGTPLQHVRGLSRRLGVFLDDDFLTSERATDWPSLLAYLEQHPRPLDLVLDEFPYLCQADASLPSLLQSTWDRAWKDAPVRLILCGSSVSFMEQEILAEPSPLFGRRTGQLRLRSMDFWSTCEFLPRLAAESRVAAYACVGGTPAYLAKLTPARSLAEGLVRQILDPVSYLHEEPRLLLHQELRELKHYFALLASIAGGNTRLNEIAQDVGIESGHVSRYLDTLLRLELVERQVPVTEKTPERSRKGLYRVSDPFFRFWFRFVGPNLSELQEGEAEWVLRERVQPQLDHFVAPTFEDLCTQWVMRRARAGDLPFRPVRAGRWWDGRDEMDVVAWDDRWLLVGECKWSRRRVGPDVLSLLQERSRRLPGFEHHRRLYCVFSRAGFTGLRTEGDVLCVDLDAVLEDRMP